jgi:polysaccharide biosynthesis protein PelF
LLNSDTEWRAAQQAGLERVKRYYNDDLMFSSYRDLYASALAPAQDVSSAAP